MNKKLYPKDFLSELSKDKQKLKGNMRKLTRAEKNEVEYAAKGSLKDKFHERITNFDPRSDGVKYCSKGSKVTPCRIDMIVIKKTNTESDMIKQYKKHYGDYYNLLKFDIQTDETPSITCATAIFPLLAGDDNTDCAVENSDEIVDALMLSTDSVVEKKGSVCMMLPEFSDF